MITCGDWLGTLLTILNNPTNPLVSWPAVIVSPLLAVASGLMALWMSLMACIA
ncbi:MAG: hypothetical protein U1A27_03650 [Phycisphaerae bacterium]